MNEPIETVHPQIKNIVFDVMVFLQMVNSLIVLKGRSLKNLERMTQMV